MCPNLFNQLRADRYVQSQEDIEICSISYYGLPKQIDDFEFYILIFEFDKSVLRRSGLIN
jgi:hypothetical protein